MDERKVTIYGEPATGNYRIITRTLPSGRAAASMAMTKQARAWRKEAAKALRALEPLPILVGPVELYIVAYLGRPGRLIWKTRPMPTEWAPRKPDTTNLQKLAEDALIDVWIKDDAQVVRATTTKYYAAGPGYGDPRPRMEISLWPLAVPDGSSPVAERVAQGGLFR